MERSYRLTYFNIRGLAEPIRWMFKIRGVPFDDERIDVDLWGEERSRFDKHVGQLPILKVDDKFELTQVHSVMRWVAKELGFDGSTEMEKARADEVVELVYDLRLCAVDQQKGCFNAQHPDIVRHTIFRDFNKEKAVSKKVILRKRIMEIFPLYMTKLAQFLEDSGGEYLAGPNLTYADLAVANFLDVCEDNINPDILSDFPTLKALKEEVFDIPQIAESNAGMRNIKSTAA